MKLKKLVAMLAAVSMVFGLVACGGTKTGNEGDKTSKDEYDWSAGADASGGEVTLNVTTWRAHDEAYYNEIIKRFEEKYDWIDVELKLTADSNSYYTNLQADMMNGTAPDVFDSHPGRIINYVNEGLVVPQTDFDYVDTLTDTAKKVSFIDDECYSYLNAYNYVGFMYNKAIFEKQGIAVPKTPEELVAAVNKLKGAGYGGIVYAGAQYGSGLATAALYISVEGDGYDGMMLGIDNGSITDISKVDGVANAMDTIALYGKEDVFYNAYEGIGFEAGMSLFAQEKSAIIYGGSWAIGEKAHYFPNVDVGFFPVPTYANNGKSFAEAAQSTMIYSGSKNLGAAKLWVEHLASAEISEYYCTSAKMMPVIEGVNCTFEGAEELVTNVSGYAIASSNSVFKNKEYWESGLGGILEAVLFEGEDWTAWAKRFASELEEYDLANE